MEQETGTRQSAESMTSTQLVITAQLRRQLADLMHVEEHEVLSPPDAAIVFRGQVHGDVEAAFEQMTQRFGDAGYTVWLRDRPGGGHEVIATKGRLERKPGRVWLNVVLLVATILSALYIGAQYALTDAGLLTPMSPLTDWLFVPLTHLHQGLPFAGTLMGILLAHELSHYFVARRYGSPVSLPYFIPMPASIIGTMGAVIVQRAPMRNRKALFDIGIAGPLGGLIVTIPLLIVGLASSSLEPPPLDFGGTITQEGNSLLYLGLKYLVFGKVLPSNGEDVWLNSVAFAAWAGLLVTMINLIPVGQLDGGHVSYALLGRRAWTLGYIAVAGMVVWGSWLLMSGNEAGGFWLTWSFLNLFLNRRHPPPVDDATKLGWPRIALGLLMLVIFILLFMPAPLRTIPVQ